MTQIWFSLANLTSLVHVRSNVQRRNLKLPRQPRAINVFGNEVLQFVDFSNEFLEDIIGKYHFLYKLIMVKHVTCSFPNVEMAIYK